MSTALTQIKKSFEGVDKERLRLAALELGVDAEITVRRKRNKIILTVKEKAATILDTQVEGGHS